MFAEILVRYLHFIGIFAIVRGLVGEHLIMKSVMTRREIRRMLVLDRIYGAGAVLAIGMGFVQWFLVGKAASFYSNNWIFLTKVGLAILLGILSLPPTFFINKHKKGDDLDATIELPGSIKMYIRLELVLLVLIPLCATFMAKGIGYFGE